MTSVAVPAAVSALRLGETLVYAIIGGGLLTFLEFPAGWLSGAMLVVTAAALLGRPVGVPAPLHAIIFLVLGTMLGSVVTPETLKGVMTWPLSIAVLAIATACATLATMTYLRLVHGWDTMSAFLASVPGALSQAMYLAAQTHSDVRGIAVVQSMRVIVLTFGVPFGLGLAGYSGRVSGSSMALADYPWGQLAVLAIASTLAGIALHKLQMRAGFMFGAMLASGILHGSGLISATLPWWLTSSRPAGLARSWADASPIPICGSSRAISARRSAHLRCCASLPPHSPLPSSWSRRFRGRT